MPEYRRQFVPGGSYFFTVNLQNRGSKLLTQNIESLRSAIRKTRYRYPFTVDAWVVLPNHMHAVWTMPDGDSDYPTRWRLIKTHFTKSLGTKTSVWQKRYWEHAIVSVADFNAHVDYVHVNPLKHGIVSQVRDWPYSTFHRYVALGIYSDDWAGDSVEEVIDAGEAEL